MIILKSLLILIFINTLNAKESGICLEWSEGDAQHLNSCTVTSEEACSKGKKAIKLNDTSFQSYTGSLFSNDENSTIFEFRKNIKDNCKSLLIQSARAAESTMCGNWDKSVYSTGLKEGDKAFIFGKSVNIRSKANTKSKKLFSLKDRTEIKIIEKSSEMDSVKNLYSAYWFKISAKGKTGWVYGQFIHPDPNSEKEFIE